MSHEPENTAYCCTNEACAGYLAPDDPHGRGRRPYTMQACIMCCSPLMSYRYGPLAPDEQVTAATAAERAAVVSFLRQKAVDTTNANTRKKFTRAASQIERAAHLKQGT